MWTCLILLPLLIEGRENLLQNQLKNWTDTFGNAIFDFGNVATKYEEIQRRFQSSPNSAVNPVNLKKVVEEMANETYVSLKEKVDAIRKLGHWAEQKALEYFEKPEAFREEPPKSYLNAKKINFVAPLDAGGGGAKGSSERSTEGPDPLILEKLNLKMDEHFGVNVNLNTSTIHIPSFVYDRREDILDGVHWTSGMDEVFRSNYAKNPTLLWQYFGSSLGFFRQYPAMKWPKDNTDRKEPDMFDCRLRPWYTGAANSPKNIVILHDVSGSMMGLRREIGRHVVQTILDTLTENDYVNVLNFTDKTSPLVPCYKDGLIQATLENVREFKVALDQDRTREMANFTAALNAAYSMLEKHRDLNRSDSANCNEAIMLITDGLPDLFSEIFDPHNEELLGRTRVFTYLIGRDVTETAEILSIACSNKGYFAHVTTIGQVEEQVVKYLAVMSRPMVMANVHTVSWTNVYADIVDIQESDWLWDEKNRAEQKSRSQRYKALLKKLKNETEKQDFYIVGDDDDSRPVPKGKKNMVSYSAKRAAEFLDYGIINPSEEELREMFAHRERQSRPQPLPPLLPLPAGPRRTKRDSTTTVTSTNFSPFHLPHHNYHHQPYPLPWGEALSLALAANSREHDHQKILLLARKSKHDAKKENVAKWGPSPRKYRFMVSVSLPVFDQRNTTEHLTPVTTKAQANNETQTVDEMTKEKIAIFLGVVGTDIPISEFLKIATPFKIGVNGYALALTENGHVIFHPDWRPLFTDLLKPNYNSVDLSKVELADTDRYERNFDPKLMEMRREMINMEMGAEAAMKTISVRVPLDEFRRVLLRRQKYAYVKIPNTVYTLAITLPESQQYEFTGGMEIRRDGQGRNVTHFFEAPDEPRRWRVNPDWTYCEYIRGAHPEFRDNKEGLILHFLREIQQANTSWPWRNTGIGITRRQPTLDSQVYICDKHLVQALVLDANVTGVFNLKWYRSYQKDMGQIMNPFGPLVGFIATRSGLTRWVNYTDSTPFTPFSRSDIRATEELWYKRAVDRYDVDRGLSYVLSVPYDAGTRGDSYVTATRAIFVHRSSGGRGGNRAAPPVQQSAPVAVAGVQFEHEKMAKRFFDIASRCDGRGCLKCRDELDCYVIDDNGYIVVAARHEFTGRFFGEVHGEILEQLVNHDIYKRVHVVDYQAICFHLFSKSGFGMILQNPFRYFQWMVKWFIGRMAWLMLQVNLHSYFSPDFSAVLADIIYVDEEYSEDQEKNPNWHPFFGIASINKTRLRPCHKEYLLYTYGKKYYSDLYTKGYHPGILADCDGFGHNGFYGVHLINRTNLIMIAIDAKCPALRSRKGVGGQEVQYTIDEEIEKLATSNDVINQICRTPYIPLERKRPSSRCLFFNEDEKDLRPDCGAAAGLNPSFALLNLLSIIILVKKFLLH
ncbi:voltage-dependent calcium channel subunit alpha-2/delta-3 isoform X2 [Folsomia candida]|uniref:voltage-dependent calcium channel subunit alpha-2/delta-3 isoform X2 n=1 Tax=Folsomia candida TaxID=158441 RepID=UPI001605142B|nr:voltage-dependent calcium channel subunit alpha-2/delta-3 isoform X2 [Folsomia candida]